MEPRSRRAVFLDRDGVLNFDSPHFIKNPEELNLIPGSAAAIAALNAAGFLTPVITNQSGIGRGLFSYKDLDAIHEKLIAEIETAGGSAAGIYICPHHPNEDCDCRKPKPGLILRAAADLNIDLANSWFVGDKSDDVLCAQNAGCKSVLVLSGKTVAYNPENFQIQPDLVAGDLLEAAKLLIADFVKS